VLGGIVRGKVTTLRVPKEEDLPHVNAWMADMRVRRGGHLWDQPAWVDTWKERLKEVAKEQLKVLWIVEADGKAIGVVQIAHGWSAPWTDQADISFFVLGADHWRRGYGWDAALALHRYLFDYLDLRWSAVSLPADNAAGLRIAEKLGYREFGRGHDVYYRDGAYADRLELRFDRETWAERWATEREYEPLPEEIAR
jgi:RimJ/RimL family protein N-acetyltransferase